MQVVICMPVLTVRCSGSHTVALSGAAQMGSLATGLPVSLSTWPATGARGSPLKAGMGPRVLPSQEAHPMAHPLENQKQA